MYFPLLDDNIAIAFLVKIPQNFARGNRSWFKRLGIFVDVFVKSPLKVTRTLPKFNGIVLAFIEKES